MTEQRWFVILYLFCNDITGCFYPLANKNWVELSWVCWSNYMQLSSQVQWRPAINVHLVGSFIITKLHSVPRGTRTRQYNESVFMTVIINTALVVRRLSGPPIPAGYTIPTDTAIARLAMVPHSLKSSEDVKPQVWLCLKAARPGQSVLMSSTPCPENVPLYFYL